MATLILVVNHTLTKYSTKFLAQLPIPQEQDATYDFFTLFKAPMNLNYRHNPLNLPNS